VPFEWADFVTLAQQLRDQDGEASHRSAISRAYYGVFCQARNHLEKQDKTSKYRDGDVHSNVWRAYDNRGRTYKAVGTSGRRLRELRNKVDYDDDIEKLEDKLIQTFSEVDKILQYLQQVQQHNQT
jgi:uncharacterized protein (UPF0332 family)